jgi:hypothetical protein
VATTSIVLVGAPDSGKTNYIGRLWTALRSRTGRLVAPQVPTDIQYVEETVAHLMQGEFAPRSAKSLGENRRDFVVPVVHADQATQFDLVVPDVSGELWKSAVETFEIAAEWMDQLRQSRGAILFVRVLSEQNIAPLDWVTTEQLLRMQEPGPANAGNMTTQVLLCELLRFLAHTLRGSNGRRPRVAVVVTAWDLLDRERRAAGPMAYLQAEYPLFAGMLADSKQLEVEAYGVTIVGGDFEDPEFRSTFLEGGDLQSAGYCVANVGGNIQQLGDLTYPVAWVVERLRPE